MIAMNRDSQMPVLNRWGLEALMEHQEKMAVIRMRTQKRKQHKRKVMAAKKKVKRCLMYTCAVITLSVSLIYAILNDPYEPPKPEEKMIQAEGSDYYYTSESYNQYLEEKERYMEVEKR